MATSPTYKAQLSMGDPVYRVVVSDPGEYSTDEVQNTVRYSLKPIRKDYLLSLDQDFDVVIIVPLIMIVCSQTHIQRVEDHFYAARPLYSCTPHHNIRSSDIFSSVIRT